MFIKYSRSSPISFSKHEGTATTSQQAVKGEFPNILNGAGVSKKRKGKFVRQYSQKFLKFGFTVAPCSEQFPLPLCLVCSKVLSNDVMKPCKLERHLNSTHVFGKWATGLFWKTAQWNEKWKTWNEKADNNRKVSLSASYLIALQISKTKKTFAIGEELIKPCIVQLQVNKFWVLKQPENFKMSLFRITRFKGEL